MKSELQSRGQNYIGKTSDTEQYDPKDDYSSAYDYEAESPERNKHKNKF